MSFTIRGTMNVNTLRVTLDDGRVVALYQDGTVEVQLGENNSNGYRIELPTVERVAHGCLDSGHPCGEMPVMVAAYHRP